MPRDCAYLPNGCTECPAIADVPARPAQTLTSVHLGWTGANSVRQLGHHRRCVFKPGYDAAGVVVGLRASRDHPDDPSRVRHGIYFFMAGPVRLYVVYERGVLATQYAQRSAEDEFEIRVSNGTARYLRNGEVFYVSSIPARSYDVVTGCLYLSGDYIE